MNGHAKIYSEYRKAAVATGHESLAADLARHLYTRQYLGKAVVLCENPIGMVSSARKQWLKLSRTLQRQRSSTMNADKILKFTHGIAHMQHLRFSSKTPMEIPEADIFFLNNATTVMPAQCFTIYIMYAAPQAHLIHAVSQMPDDALVVHYGNADLLRPLHLAPKKELDRRVGQQWRQVQRFLQGYHIDPGVLQHNGLSDVEAVDNALDTLLGVSHAFLQVAGDFQRTLEMARPLRLPKATREKYDALILLAHRVQALMPGSFSQQFLQVYNEDDTFFLYDLNKKRLVKMDETLEVCLERHIKAGRGHLARALHQTYMGRSFHPAR